MEGIVLVAHHRLLRCVLASFQGLFSQRGGHLFETSLARTFSTAMANKENKNEGAELGKEQEKIDNFPGKQNGSKIAEAATTATSSSRSAESQKESGLEIFHRKLREAMDMPMQFGLTPEAVTESQREKALALARLHNSMSPMLEGHMIKAKVLQVGQKSFLLDTGISCVRIAASELTPECILQKAETEVDGTPRRREDIIPGDIVEVLLEQLDTPDGSMLVSGPQAAVQQRFRAVWHELCQSFVEKRPVKGRILNKVNGGYAVGIGGLVCFAPSRSVAPSTGRRIGVLQEFRIVQMKQDDYNVVVEDFHYRRR